MSRDAIFVYVMEKTMDWEQVSRVMDSQSKAILDAYFAKGCPCNDEQFRCFVQKDQGHGSQDGFQIAFIEAVIAYPKYTTRMLGDKDGTPGAKAEVIRKKRNEYVRTVAKCTVCGEEWVHVLHEWRMGALADRLMPTRQDPLDPEEAALRYAQLSARPDNPWQVRFTSTFSAKGEAVEDVSTAIPAKVTLAKRGASVGFSAKKPVWPLLLSIGIVVYLIVRWFITSVW